ncbi:uncharacterized protein LOC132705906 [Cylas formicarius]|uniref:uncharacterized protein LOC132705906 n=1 Tax=Cylas formicarius TaxID=197179 RepID=UPI0029583D1C|nr:uncharacterized protein LOC132705906 [Cylas formicarius]
MMLWIPAYLIIFIAFPSIVAKPAMDSPNLRYEEYVVEHDISATQARNVALSTNYNEVTPLAGCQECTKEEIHYCLGSDLISDHCCCDKRYHEVLPFIPHTCYFGTQLCSPVQSDCAKYTRVRTCCCDRYLLQKWKEKLSASSNRSKVPAFLCFLVLVVQIFIL